MSSLEELIGRFSQLTFSQNDERMKINSNTLLDEIIACLHLTRKKDGYNDEAMLSFINFGCCHLADVNVLMKSKFCQAVSYMVGNSKISPTKSTADDLVVFVSNTLVGRNSPAISLADILKALLVILENWTEHLDVSLEICQEMLWHQFQQNSTTNNQMSCHALQCLVCIIPRLCESSRYDREAIKFSIEITVKQINFLLDNHQDTIDFYKLLAQTLKLLLTILVNVKQNDELFDASYTISLLKVFLVYGLPNVSSRLTKLKNNLPKTTQKEPFAELQPISRKERSMLPKKMVNKRKSKRVSGRVNADMSEPASSAAPEDTWDLMASASSGTMGWQAARCLLSSESEISDSEMGHLDKMRALGARVRQNALRCIQNLLKCCERKMKFSCWLILLPETKSDSEISLLQVLLDDPNFKVRQNAVMCIMELVDGSRPFLDAAVMSTSTIVRPFTAFSVKLNQSLLQLHESLTEALSREVADAGLEKVVRCLMLVILNSPYNKIDQDILLNLVPKIGKLLSSKDTGLLVSSLTCIAAVMSVRPQQVSLVQALDMANCPLCIQTALSSGSIANDFGSTWIVKFCCYNIQTAVPDENQDVQRIVVESLQVLGVITKYYAELIRPHGKIIVELLYKKCFNWDHPSVAFFGIKLFEEFGRLYDGLCSKSDYHTEEACEHWQAVFSGPLLAFPTDGLSNCPSKVKACVCDCLSTMGTHVFGTLPVHQQICCKALLLGLAAEEDNFIKSTAVRALGVFILYPCVADDPSFFCDVVRICIDHMKSKSIAVRSKVSWSLGNVCDSMVKNRHVNGYCDLPNDLFLQLLKTSSSAAKDHDKVNPNGVRAIGLLLKGLPTRLINDPFFSHEIDIAIRAVLPKLVSGPMKGRWNACYAMANAFHNQAIPLGSAPWTDDVFSALVVAMSDCKNFKVRISAVVALATPRTRDKYGSVALLYKLWTGVLDALGASKQLADFTEFKYKEALQDQLVELLLHFIGCFTCVDIASLDQLEEGYLDCMYEHLECYKTKREGVEEGAVGDATDDRNTSSAPSSNTSTEMASAVSAMDALMSSCVGPQKVLKELHSLFSASLASSSADVDQQQGAQ